MFDAFTVCDEDLEWIFVVAAKMIFKRFQADGASHGFFPILAPKQDDFTIEIVSLLWLGEYELTLIDHAQYGQDAYDGR